MMKPPSPHFSQHKQLITNLANSTKSCGKNLCDLFSKNSSGLVEFMLQISLLLVLFVRLLSVRIDGRDGVCQHFHVLGLLIVEDGDFLIDIPFCVIVLLLVLIISAVSSSNPSRNLPHSRLMRSCNSPQSTGPSTHFSIVRLGEDHPTRERPLQRRLATLW